MNWFALTGIARDYKIVDQRLSAERKGINSFDIDLDAAGLLRHAFW